jgi:hypothetical protein
MGSGRCSGISAWGVYSGRHRPVGIFASPAALTEITRFHASSQSPLSLVCRLQKRATPTPLALGRAPRLQAGGSGTSFPSNGNRCGCSTFQLRRFGSHFPRRADIWQARMTSVYRTIKFFDCPNCGLGYRGIQKPLPFLRAGRFDCVVCTAEVHAWCGYYDFDLWRVTAASWDTVCSTTSRAIKRTADSR